MGVPESKSNQKSKNQNKNKNTVSIYDSNSYVNTYTNTNTIYSTEDDMCESALNLKIKKYFTNCKYPRSSNNLSNTKNSNDPQMRKSNITKKLSDRKKVFNLSNTLIREILNLHNERQINFNYLKIFDPGFSQINAEGAMDLNYVDSYFDFFVRRGRRLEGNKIRTNTNYEKSNSCLNNLINILEGGNNIFVCDTKDKQETDTKLEKTSNINKNILRKQKENVVSISDSSDPTVKKNSNSNLKTVKLNLTKKNSNTIITKSNSNNDLNKDKHLRKTSPNNNKTAINEANSPYGTFINNSTSKSPSKYGTINNKREKSPSYNTALQKSKISNRNIKINTNILRIDLRKKDLNPIKITDEYSYEYQTEDLNSTQNLNENAKHEMVDETIQTEEIQTIIYSKKKINSNTNFKIKSEISSMNSLNSKVISKICHSYHTESNSIFSNIESIKSYDILSLKEKDKNYAGTSSNSYLEIMRKKKEIEELNRKNKSPRKKKETNMNTINLNRDERIKYMLTPNRSSEGQFEEFHEDKKIEKKLENFNFSKIQEEETFSDRNLKRLNSIKIELPNEILLTSENFESTLHSSNTTKNKSNLISLQSSENSENGNKTLYKLNILKNLKTKIKGKDKDGDSDNLEIKEIPSSLEKNLEDYKISVNYDHPKRSLDVITESITQEIEENEGFNSNRVLNQKKQTPKFDSEKRFTFKNMKNRNEDYDVRPYL